MKLTPENIAVIEGDTYLSAQIIAEKRLDVAKEFLELFRQYIPEDGVVVDVGASLGDYTATFSDFVGSEGLVFAFEPNPITFEALQHNMIQYPRTLLYPIALGSFPSTSARLIMDWNNIGASRLNYREDGEIGGIEVARLDQIFPLLANRLDFLKIDAEGWEPLILDGGVQTINRFRPVMLIEVNTWPLGKMGFTANDVFDRLDALNYKFDRFDGPYGDILCVPKERA